MSEHTDDVTDDVSTLATGTIEGTVTDGDGDAVRNVTVSILFDDTDSETATTTTDANGDYSISVTSDEIYDVRFEKLLYVPKRIEDVSVIAGNTSTVDATIEQRGYKVRGSLPNEGDVGVFGHNTATTGETVGMLGVTDSGDDDAVGVRGVANSDKQFTRTIGIDGRSRAGDGIGVRGISRVGVKGISEDNYGVHGHATGDSGDLRGVFGETDSKSGRGVQGVAFDGAGDSWTSATVDGVYGATNWSGAEDGLISAHGVRGRSLATSGLAYGVTGQHYGREGAGVYGDANIRQGVAGVRGETTGAEYGSTTCYGVEGITEAIGTDAAGVRGEAAAGSGTAHGVYGTINSDADGAAAVYSDGPLRVHYQSDGVSTSVDDHAALIEDTSANYSSVLALRLGDSSADDASEFDNYVTFYESDDTAVGSIESTGSSGVNLNTSSADYAEYLPRADPAESIDTAEVVGVRGGRVSKQTDGADRVLVVSDQPAVTGNAPGQDRTGHEVVAFTGQVPVKVRGTVEPGDVIVPSGEDDGTAVAVSPAEWNPDTAIVGQAWERTDEAGISEVTVAVGIGDEDVLASAVEELQAENAALRERVDDLESRLCDLEAATTSPASADD